MKSRTTIFDVARSARISVTTVSFVMNGKSKEMRVPPEEAEWKAEAYISYLKKMRKNAT